MAISITATSPGERLVVALAILGLVGEMLSDNGCTDAPAVEASECVELCYPRDVKRWESYACECEVGDGE